MNENQPDILFIMFDQMAARALPCYGHPVVKTPHISQLAQEGVVFENAYCNSPLCAPSRFSMMSGRLPSGIGAFDNGALFPEDVPTIAHHLRDQGYYTCLSGKMHFIGADQCHGFEDRLTTDIYPADFAWTPDWDNAEKRPVWYHNMLSVVQAGPCITSNQIDFDEAVAFHSVRKIEALARKPDRRPFFFLASFTHPHDPFAMTQDYWDLYPDDRIDMPAVKKIPYEALDPHSRRLYHISAMGEYEQTRERVCRARHAYYSEISYADAKVGQLMAALEKTKLADNTLVIITSDHGDMLGERGLWYKMTYFDWAAKVPLIINFPKRFSPGRVKQPVSLVDLLPTLTDIASLDNTPRHGNTLDGTSLLPLLNKEEEDENAAVYGEILCEGAVSPVLMIRQGRYKYIYCDRDPEQLYDLKNDPEETRNLAQLAEYRSVCLRFRCKVMEKWRPTELENIVKHSQRRRQLIDRAVRKGRFLSWDFQPFEDAAHTYMRSHLDLNTLEQSARFPHPEIPDPDGEQARKKENTGIVACLLNKAIQPEIRPDDTTHHPPRAV
ncbi:MAG: choline-sulfatase [Desulfotignum sp.]|nr:choline-sulfatase [Desulfotignum sp.]MCF8114292.1 choline-sulfatase [Desulfotignum sp.]MCF8126690.1 choline-sulfatase [Desulfotignum sp.]